MRRRALIQTAVFLLFGIAVSAQEAQKSPGLSYLLDGAVRIYVVDESRCSAGPNSKEGGRWYLIEGEEILGRLKKALAEVDEKDQGGCLCGGPDIHFYAAPADGPSRYFGLDCGTFLDGVPLPEELQSQLTPSSKAFVGKAGGMTHVCDIPLAVEEEPLRKRFSDADFILLTGGGWNLFTSARPRSACLYRHLWETSPVALELSIGPFSGPRCSDPTSREDRDAEWKSEAENLVKEWIEKAGLSGELLDRSGVRGSTSTHAKGWVTAFFREHLILGDADRVRKALKVVPLPEMSFREELRRDERSEKAEPPVLWMKECVYRSAEERSAKGRYQAALLLWDTDPPERLEEARRLLREGGTITFLCERKPSH